MSQTTPARITPDEMALRALAAGSLTVDAETGAIHRANGKRAEYPRPNGYGVVSLYEPGQGARVVGAHRVVWLALHGPIPPGLQVNHRNKRRWDNRPENLELVTPADNHHHRAGTDYVSIGGDTVDLAWLDQVRELLDSDDIEALDALRGEPLSSPIKPYAGGSVVAARAPSRMKRRNV